jgi:undecaprenyl-diphosphatase
MVVAILGVVGFVGIFATVKAKQSQAFDLALTMKFQAGRHPLLASVMRLVSWPGFPPQSRVIPPTVMAGLWLLRFRLEAVFQLLAWGTGGLSTVVKALMKRPRPVAGTDLRVVAAPLGGSSFPSGHVITYAGTYGWMAYMAHTLIRPRHLRRSLVMFFAGLVALVGPSRIYQGHHWPTDVIASYMLGLSYFIGLSGLYRRFKRQRALE